MPSPMPLVEPVIRETLSLRNAGAGEALRSAMAMFMGSILLVPASG